MSLVSFTATVLATLQFTFLLSPGILSPWCHCLSVLIPDLPPRSVRPMLPVSALTSVEVAHQQRFLGTRGSQHLEMKILDTHTQLLPPDVKLAGPHRSRHVPNPHVFSLLWGHPHSSDMFICVEPQ